MGAADGLNTIWAPIGKRLSSQSAVGHIKQPSRAARAAFLSFRESGFFTHGDRLISVEITGAVHLPVSRHSGRIRGHWCFTPHIYAD